MGSRIAERAKAHFIGIGMRSVEVPEWGADGKPLVVWFKPISLAEREKAHVGAADFAEIVVRTIVMKAMDENGERLFSAEDKMILRTEAAGDVVQRIFQAMDAAPPKPSDLSGN